MLRIIKCYRFKSTYFNINIMSSYYLYKIKIIISNLQLINSYIILYTYPWLNNNH